MVWRGRSTTPRRKDTRSTSRLPSRATVALLILLVSEPDEHEAMYEGVFVPAVEALVPPG